MSLRRSGAQISRGKKAPPKRFTNVLFFYTVNSTRLTIPTTSHPKNQLLKISLFERSKLLEINF